MIDAGNLVVLGLVAQQAVLPTEIPEHDKDAERLLHERAMSYIDRWNQAEEELAALLGLPLLRPLPTLVTVGNLAEVTRLLDVPHGLEWRGVYVDADFRAVELAGGDAAKRRLFMQLAGLQGSALEELVLSEGFGVPAIATAKLLGLANESSLATLRLDQTNLAGELPLLNLPDLLAADITPAVTQGQVVTIPQLATSYEDWLGYGYLKDDLESGEAGWMLSGMIAGGMTAWNPERWPLNAAAEVLANSFNAPPNRDTGSALFIQKITATDQQVGTVGQPLPRTLQVYVTDSDHRPVKGAAVIFTVKAGGGTLNGLQTVTANSDYNGVAGVELVPGWSFSADPTYYLDPAVGYYRLASQNIVDAALESGAVIAAPFIAYARPSLPTALERIELSLNPESGVAAAGAIPPRPFTTALRVEPQLNNPMVTYHLGWEYSGSAVSPLMSVDSSSPDGTEHQLSFHAPGVYTVYCTITDSLGVEHTASIKVEVLDRDALDGLLRAKWDKVKSAWASHDVEGGLAYFAESSKANYRGALNALVAELPQIASEMQDIELVYARGRYAKYRLNRHQDINGTMVDMTYYLYFVKDHSGLWKVDQF